MPAQQQQVTPNTPIPADLLIDKTIRDKAINDHLKKDLATNAVLYARMGAEYKKLVDDAAAEGKDIREDVKENILKAHSEWSACGAVLGWQHKDMQDAKDVITERMGGVDKTPDLETAPLQSKSLWDRVEEVSNKSNNPALNNQSIPMNERLGGLSTGTTMTIPMGVGEIMNTLFKRDAGWEPESVREGGFVDIKAALTPLEILELINITRTTQAAVKYMEESLFTNAAAAIAEGEAYPESALKMIEKTVNVEKIGTHLPVTDEQLEDEGQAQAYLNQRLPLFVRQALNNAILNGTGTNNQILGLLNHTGIGDMAWEEDGTDTTKFAEGRAKIMDDLYKASSKAWLDSWIPPTAYVIAEQAWTECVLRKTDAAGYILGSPQGVFSQQMWGLPITRSVLLSLAKGKVGAICGNFTLGVDLAIRRDIVFEKGYINDQFIKDMQTLKASVRAALVTRRPASIVRVTKTN